MPRRARNEGSIRKRADGRFEARLTDPGTGARRSGFGRTEAEALEKLKAVQRQLEDGLPLGDERLTLATYLTQWLVMVEPTVKPTT